MSSIILTDDNFDIQSEMQSQNWAKRIGECLEKHYPNYGWAVHADARNNIATVQALRLSGEHGFYLHLDQIGPSDKKIIWAGGEVLERYGVARSHMREDQVYDKVRDLRGNVIGDVS